MAYRCFHCCVKAERSRAQRRLASNFLTARPKPYHRQGCLWHGLFQHQMVINHRWSMNSSSVKPTCSMIPLSVPGLRGLCCGTTTVLDPLRKIRCEPVCRSWTKPQRFNARTASAPLTSRGIFTTPRGLGLAKSANGRSWDVDQPRNSPKRHRRS